MTLVSLLSNGRKMVNKEKRRRRVIKEITRKECVYMSNELLTQPYTVILQVTEANKKYINRITRLKNWLPLQGVKLVRDIVLLPPEKLLQQRNISIGTVSYLRDLLIEHRIADEKWIYWRPKAKTVKCPYCLCEFKL